jgi:hypothetical protein
MKKNEPYDLTEEASKRTDESATDTARFLESDDANESFDIDHVSSPEEDSWAENSVATSLDDE